MNVYPVVVPIKLFRVPCQERLLIFSDSLEQRTHIVGTKDVSVLDREWPEDLKRLGCFSRYLFNAVDTRLHPVDDLHHASATPARPCPIKERRRLFCGGVEHRN